MKNLVKYIIKRMAPSGVAVLVAGLTTNAAFAKEWKAWVGAQSPDLGSQAQAFLPNEMWINAGDSIRWTLSSSEIHTVTFLTATQLRPPNFGMTFGVGVGVRDSPAVVRRWLDSFDRHFIGLTGTERAIEAVEGAAGVPVAQKTGPANGGYGVAHANFVLAYSRDNFAHVIYPGGVSKDDWVHDLPLLIRNTWRGR
jgi:plastocyanin